MTLAVADCEGCTPAAVGGTASTSGRLSIEVLLAIPPRNSGSTVASKGGLSYGTLKY